MRQACFVGVPAVLLLVLATACDSTPTSSSSLPIPSQPQVFTQRLEITGPESVPPGQSVQYTAIAHRSDGTTTDVTRTASWNSSNGSVLTIAAGLARGLTQGETVLRATSGASAARVILVLPDGTFRVAGRVHEFDSPTLGISGVRIETSAGAAGPVAVSGFDGRYALHGVPGTSEIRAAKEGYQTFVQPVALATHASLDVALAPASPRSNVAGRYILTIDAADDCRARLPEEARTRRYAATISQQGALLSVDLTDGNLVVDQGGNGDGFGGRLEPGQALFVLDELDFYYYRTIADIVEEISPELFVISAGLVSASVTPNRIAGALNGVIMTTTSDPRKFPTASAMCRSTGHRFSLER